MKSPIVVLFAVLIGPTQSMNSSEAQPQTNTTSAAPFFVVGDGWNKCADWKEWSADVKIGYALGHGEGVSQSLTFLNGQDAHTFAKLKAAFTASEGLKYGELTKAVDDFCGDYRNMKIPVPNAMMLVSGEIAGAPSQGEKEIRYLRCAAAAGNDQDKIRTCLSQP